MPSNEADTPSPARRIAIVGVTGTGKTTLGQHLSRLYGVSLIELDALNWEPNWTSAPKEVFQRRVEEATRSGGWVADGNYGEVRHIVCTRADTLVWLDYNLPLILWRLFWRTLRRTLRRETLWNGNRERFWTQFVTRDSLFLWALKTYRRRRREYSAVGRQPGYAHLKVVRLRSPSETRRWLEGLESRSAPPGFQPSLE